MRTGELSIQSEASQLVALLLGAAPGERVLDACAGGGGKATYLAELMNDRGVVVAADTGAHHFERARREITRLGVGAMRLLRADARRPPLRPASFDRVLLDAPCTGVGTLRQHPEIRWRRQPRDVAANAALQQALLDALLAVVRPGGELVYATCSLLREENDGVLQAVLPKHTDVDIVDARAHLPPAAGDVVDSDGAMRTLPSVHGLDGFYAVRLKRH